LRDYSEWSSVRLGRRFRAMLAMLAMGIVAVAALLVLSDPGAAASLLFRSRTVSRSAETVASADLAAPARNATSAPPRKVGRPARQALPSQPSQLPAGDDPYPVVLPQIRAGATSVIQSEGVALYVQNVSYGDPADGNSYDVYWPVRPALRRGGAVLMIHGGSWIFGRKDMDTPYALATARAGYVTAVMDYSTFPHMRAWPAAAQDAFAAADSFRSRSDIYGFDPGHLVAAGWSAGGNLAELLGTVGRGTDRVAAVVAWSGISDMTKLPSIESTSALADALGKLIGCSLSACPHIWRNGSPVTHVGNGDAPTLLFAGSREYVPSTQSSALRAELHSAGIPAELQILDTDLHGLEQRPLTTATVLDWLHRYADAGSATA
jgi:acetyl esterase/lipase